MSMASEKDKDKYLAAAHEAGHATVAICLGMHFNGASIQKDESGLWGGSCHRLRDDGEPEDDPEIYPYLVAGLIGETLFAIDMGWDVPSVEGSHSDFVGVGESHVAAATITAGETIIANRRLFAWLFSKLMADQQVDADEAYMVNEQMDNQQGT